ncbi:hypothetical protein [Bacillus solimangrovi]|uniref:Transporter n=1 Tax=Bacillus solimangrovi TaxID=1305675 RepID=A0A1E5LIT6_9BACI|nr:hypothetical protein [Bacillus solimangrovi]OEH93999.1 hypothetical protein BFG57_10155 [Bacillus solimangrovi]
MYRHHSNFPTHNLSNHLLNQSSFNHSANEHLPFVNPSHVTNFVPLGQGNNNFPTSQNNEQAPSSPPPQYIPQQQTSSGLTAVDPRTIAGCLYRFTYIWMRGGNSFWFYPVYVGRRSVSGYRWTGRNWIYAGYSLRRIISFHCH